LEDRLFNFFVLTNIPQQRILHVQITFDLQKTLTAEFRRQRNEFMREREEIEYKPGYHLDPHEVFKINPFDDLDNLLPITSSPSTLNSLEPDSELYGHITAFFSTGDDDKELLFQNFDRRRVISTKGSLIWSNNTYRQMDAPGLNLATSLAAILRRDDLLFHSSWCARRIFDLTQYLREATDDQVMQFLKHTHFHCSDVDKVIEKFSTWERNKVCLILESGILDDFNTEQMKMVAADLQYELLLNNEGRMIFPEDKKRLKGLLRFLAEDYMMSPLTEKLHVVTSKRPIFSPSSV
jgi:hypothetical protein